MYNNNKRFSKGETMLKFSGTFTDWIAFIMQMYGHISNIIDDKKLTYKDKPFVKKAVYDLITKTSQELNWDEELTGIRLAEGSVIVDEIFYHIPHPVLPA